MFTLLSSKNCGTTKCAPSSKYLGQIGRLHIHLYFLRMKIVYLTKETFCRYNSRLFLKFRKHSSPGTFPLVIVSAAPFLCRAHGALLSSRWLRFFFHSLDDPSFFFFNSNKFSLKPLMK